MKILIDPVEENVSSIASKWIQTTWNEQGWVFLFGDNIYYIELIANPHVAGRIEVDHRCMPYTEFLELVAIAEENERKQLAEIREENTTANGRNGKTSKTRTKECASKRSVDRTGPSRIIRDKSRKSKKSSR